MTAEPPQTSSTAAPPGAPVNISRARASLMNPDDRAFWVGLVVVVLSLIAALATYAVLTGLTPIPPRGDVVLGTLLINAVLILAMFAMIAWQMVGLVRAWRDKVPGARLQVRVVALFSLIAVLPAVLLALAAATTFSRSLDGWFSKKTREIIDNSGEVARAYIDVHGQLIITDILNMARDIDAEAASGSSERGPLKTLLLAQTTLRGLPVGYIIDKDGKRVAAAFDDDKVPFARPPADAITRADAGQVPLLDSSATSRVYAVAKLNAMPGRYLYVARELSPAVVAQMRRTQQNTDEYQRLRDVSRNLKIAHGLMYFMIASTALLAAIWAGLWFAARFVSPIRRLIEGAELVSRGDLTVALPEKRGEGDLRRFSATFNRMTRELKHQRDALVTFNEQLNARRRFTEAVLSGVSAGVIGLDSAGTITLVSRSAERLLSVDGDSLTGRALSEALPEFAEALSTTVETAGKHRSARQASRMVGADERTFAVEVTREQAGEAIVGSVVTFDDVTDLVVAQRTAAWADVARRIAHEIKNPLTPIQLSAERIRRKYGPQIVTDKDTFEKLTDAISRQVDVIKSMVDEFASFARLPQPTMETGDLREVVHGPVVLFRESHPQIDFILDIPSGSVPGVADRRLLSQALTNLVKNATEAIDGLLQERKMAGEEAPAGWRGQIEIRLVREAERAIIEVIDNGIGLPKQNRARLLEPYVTTRAKGTGLGLAIVQKIVEQHKGMLELDDAPITPRRTRGARVRLTLPMPPLAVPMSPLAVPVAALPLPVTAEPVAALPSPSETDEPAAAAATAEPGPVAAEAITTTAMAPDPIPATTATPPDPSPAEPRPERAKPPVQPVASATLMKNSGRIMPRPESRTKGARP
jgi:two-component system nitrogen regulation sensor histidine kinase NtrY